MTEIYICPNCNSTDIDLFNRVKNHQLSGYCKDCDTNIKVDILPTDRYNILTKYFEQYDEKHNTKTVLDSTLFNEVLYPAMADYMQIGKIQLMDEIKNSIKLIQADI